MSDTPIYDALVAELGEPAAEPAAPETPIEEEQ
jgi:hypothetical protein